MRRLFIGFGIFLLLVLIVLRISDPAPVQSLRLAYFDQLQQWQPRALEDLPVKVVDIDELALAEHGQWPWPRYKLADLVTRLRASGAAAVVFDVLFLEPDRLSPKHFLSQSIYVNLLGKFDPATLPDNDTLFAQAIAGNQVVLGVSSAVTTSQGLLPQKAGIVEIGDSPSLGFPRAVGVSPPLPELSAAAEGLASINMSPYDTAGRVRRVPLLWTGADGQIIPSLALEALRVALGEKSFLVRGEPGQLGVTQSIRVGSFDIPTRSDGSIWVRFRPDHPSLYRSAHDVLTGTSDELRADFNGRIVLVGTSAAGLLDIRTTALDENVPGVSIHAQIIEQILQGKFVSRNDSIAGIEILIFLVLGGIILWVMSNSGALLSITTSVSIGMLVMAASWFLFQERGILLDVTLPIFGGVLFFSAMTAFQFFVADREKKMIRSSFSHYVAPNVLKQIEDSGYHIELGGELKPISVMFCDIRNFTALSETMEANDMVSLLNNLFSVLSSEILNQQGTIDKFIGDSIMAFWNAPLDTENYPYCSCLAALAMRRALDELNPKLDPKPEKDIGIAIGISMGIACVGNVGSKDRFDYSAIGDAVNVAARIESSCRHINYDILVSEDVMQASNSLAFLSAGNLALKGVSKKQPVFALVGDAFVSESADFQALKEQHSTLVTSLENGQKPDQRVIDSCRHLAQNIDAKLLAFYERLIEREEDFR
jgi:adenylate cyclase